MASADFSSFVVTTDVIRRRDLPG